MGHETGRPAGAWSTAFLAAVWFVVLLHMSSIVVPSEALRPDAPYYPRKSVPDSNDGGSKLGVTASPPPAPLVEGDTYRPPVINIKYNGGPVMWKPIHLYFIWYGNWTNAEKKLMRQVTNSLTPEKKIRQEPNLSNLWEVVTEYYQEPQAPGQHRKYASDSVSIECEVDDHYSFGNNISSNFDPLSIVLSHVGVDLPKDLEQGIYFVFTSGDVVFQDPTIQYCGYHDNQCVDPARAATAFCDDYHNNIIYSFVPLPSPENGLLLGCSYFEDPVQFPGFGLHGLPPNHKLSPSGALDVMITVYLHELLETVVDPIWFLKPAWYNNLTENSETSDLCSYTFTAGDWFYCGLPGEYPDFDGVDDGRCISLFTRHTALTEPKAKTTFNLYGLDGLTVVAQQMWSLNNKGCALQQPEATCPRGAVELHKSAGTIQRGLFFKGVGLQRYAPGQNCSWKIDVHGAKSIRVIFDKVALGYDAMDYVTVSKENVVKKKVTGFGSNIHVTISGHEAFIRFVSYGGRSPVPSAAGFILRYSAEF